MLQVGWWLRDLNAIYCLPLPRGNLLGYAKVRLVPLPFPWADRYQRQLMAESAARDGLPTDPRFAENTHEIDHLADGAYDRHLAENIVLVRLYAASANNTVVECLARATPLLVNPLPAVVEYLGPGYPFTFDTLEEAAAKALDLDLVERTHRYLLACPTRSMLSFDYFRESFRQSAVYRAL